MKATDLVEHFIPTWPGSTPVRAKEKLFTAEESRWMEVRIPAMVKAGIVEYSVSRCSHRTKFVRKKDGGLRMVHVFCPVNAATVNHSYPMRRIEQIINNLGKAQLSVYLQADAANGFWAVPLYPPHAYKTAFSTSIGQFQYIRMGQGLSGVPQTYARLKDIFAGPIPEPHPERALSRISSGAFAYFVDDDFAAHPSVAAQLHFMHYSYFPRLAWAKITLNPAKSGFLLDKISPLGVHSDGKGLRPSIDKVGAIRDYPTPTCQGEVERFIYMTTYLRYFIPGRVEHTRILKRAIKYQENLEPIGQPKTTKKHLTRNRQKQRTTESKSRENEREVRTQVGTKTEQLKRVSEDNGKQVATKEEGEMGVTRGDGGGQKAKKKREARKGGVVCGFEWGEDQERSFRVIQEAIVGNAVFGGDETLQYHLTTDASRTALGWVLFQILDASPGTRASSRNRPSQRIIMFLSKPFLPAETRYSTTEREALAVLRCLEDVRWLILGSPFPTIVYTDHLALVSLLKKDDAHGRIARWQVRLSEYDVEYQHISGGENLLADGLSRMPQAATMGEAKAVVIVEEDATGKEGWQKRIPENELDEWAEWLKEDWYGRVIFYKITGTIEGIPGTSTPTRSRNVRRVLRRSACNYVLSVVEGDKGTAQLFYR